MSYLDADGKARGFVVEAMEEAARREGLTLEWKAAGDLAANNEALVAGQLDLIVGAATAERQRMFWVSDAWWSSEMVAVSLADRRWREQKQLYGTRIVTPRSALTIVSGHFQNSKVEAVGSVVEAAEAVCLKRADAGIFAAMFLRQILWSPPGGCQGIGLSVIDVEPQMEYSLIAGRPAERTARRLRARLDEIIADGTLAGISKRNPPVSTPQVIRMGEVIRAQYEGKTADVTLMAGATVLLLSILFGVRQYRSGQKLRDMNRRLESKMVTIMQGQEALRQSEERFRTLLASAPQAVLVIDGAGVVRYANARCLVLFGLQPEEIVGLDVRTLIPGWTVADSNGEREWPASRSGGTTFQALVTMGEVWRDGERLVLAFVADISERLAVEARVRESQRLESVGRLAGGVAHDFNNLLTVIKGYAELLKLEAAGSGGVREPAEEIARAADRAAGLTRQLLAFSKRQPAVLRIVDLNALVRDAEKMLGRLIPAEIALEFRPAAGDARVMADAGQLEQVVMNLVINARDAMPTGGRILIETAVVVRVLDGTDGRPGRYVALRVSDTGTGISPEVRERMFEPFFTTKELGKGTGLGLSTVYGIVRQGGGFVHVDSNVGEGTTFEILLPCQEEAPEEQPAEVHAAGSHASETVLVADDDPSIRQLVGRVLEDAGYHVLLAADGLEALALAETQTAEIHLLLTDSVMPRMGGAALSSEFAQMHPSAKILHMSGYDESTVPGGDRCLLPKPFSAAQLVARVREVLNAPEAE
jgi:PAS domain S-box-containing protein